MPRLKRLSGDKIISILKSFDFRVIKQRGSHVKLIRSFKGYDQVLTAIVHRQMDTGTTHGIFKQACKFIPEAELRKHFYSE